MSDTLDLWPKKMVEVTGVTLRCHHQSKQKPGSGPIFDNFSLGCLGPVIITVITVKSVEASNYVTAP